ncbi:unnamed protein product [Closterium sp. NIES-65]|nr:unnamed protein product [Closterium sp. NIES-65]
MDVWHKGRNLTRRFVADFIDAKESSLRVPECKSVEDVWHVTPEHRLADGVANVGARATSGEGGGVRVERGDMEDLRWEDVSEMWGYDPHPIRGVRPCLEASFLIIQASVSGRVHTPDEEADVEDVTEAAEATTSDTQDTAAGDEDAFEPPSPQRRWEERGTKKRRREEMEGVENDDLAMDDLVEEVTVGQRFSVHFHHVMVRNATLATLGFPMSAEDVAAELALAADHWAGLHGGCARGDVLPRCVKDNWGPESAVYEPDSETHKAVKEWLATHCSAEQMRPYVLGAGSWLNKSFHSLICKYAPKRVRFLGSMEARIALAVLHWNNTVERVVKAYKTRLRKATRVKRGKKDRVLGPMDWTWVDDIMRDWMASRGRPEPPPPVVTPDSDAPESVPPRDHEPMPR